LSLSERNKVSPIEQHALHLLVQQLLLRFQLENANKVKVIIKESNTKN
jgi:hypothetical protein